ncbi:MAG: TonB-dependent receptor [Cellulophaga sp.]
MRNILVLLCAFTMQFSFSQTKHTVSGIVKEAASLETVIGVNVVIPELAKGVVTNEYGFYSLTLPEGKYNLTISYLGFKTITKEINVTSNQKIDFLLEEDATSLDEVIVTENVAIANLRSPEMSVHKVQIRTIKKMPVVLGEVDILKAIQMLPGVSSAGEGASGFNVRGGAADQNLILLDEAIIYNSSHLFGFFSVFNADAIKDIKLYKGGIPSKYGGRVSSVLDIRQKDGDKSGLHASGGIGLISSRLLVEGPIDKKKKGSFLVAGRGSYAHLFLKLANKDNSAYFYDLNTKISYELNDNNKLFLSGYFGRDVFSISNSFNNSYGNATLNLRWNHLFNDKLFSNVSLIYSDYNYSLNINSVGFDWTSGIDNFNLKYDFTYYAGEKIKMQFGIDGLYYKFNPGEIKSTKEGSGVNDYTLDKKQALEIAAYVDVEHKITNDFTLHYGLRYSAFNRLGKQTVQLYENNEAVTYNNALGLYESASPIGEKKYDSGESISSYDNLEPRVGLSYRLNEIASIKAGYNRMAQYIHLISNTNSPTPLDVWAPSGKYFKPQILDQFSLGYFTNLKDNKYTLETEVFYRTTDNRIDYIDGANLLANNTIEAEVLSGESRAYGLEVLLKKNTGKLTGWLAYTLSKAEQRVVGRTALESGINNGDWYSTAYDKLHDVSVTAQYELSKKWSFGASFVYQTGRAATYPKGYYEYQDLKIPLYTGRNQDNLPAYHHLDVSMILTPKKNEGRKWKSEWVFGVYNLYAKKNAASVSFGQNDKTLKNEATQLSIFGIVPSITYNFKF